MKRITDIDFTRGLVMIIMALDHVRDLIHVDAMTQSPTDLTTTTPLLFFTRWITYLCAPIFVFLAGTSAYLSRKGNGNSIAGMNFLVKRGLWLVVLEFTIVNFGIFFNPGFNTLLFEVIAAIGFGFIILGLLYHLSSRIIGIIGLLIVFCHNLLAIIPPGDDFLVLSVLTPLFGPVAFSLTSDVTLIMAYPPIPWLGIMLLGFASGNIFQLPPARRKILLLQIGSVALLLFVLLRFANIYGDPVQWTTQKNAVFTLLSFMNVTKYPPSLLFCLVTLGIMFWILAFATGAKNKFVNTVIVYGKVPLFYFVVHFYLIHLLLIAILFFQGFHWPEMDFASGTFGRPKGVESGVGLAAVYAIWIAVVLVLFWPCRWFAKYKAEHRQWWLRYV